MGVLAVLCRSMSESGVGAPLRGGASGVRSEFGGQPWIGRPARPEAIFEQLRAVLASLHMKSGRTPVQPLWLPLLSARKNFLCYIGRGVVLCLGARRVGGPGTQRHTLKHRGACHGLSSEFRLFPPGGGDRHGGCCYAARRAALRRSMSDTVVGGPLRGGASGVRSEFGGQPCIGRPSRPEAIFEQLRAVPASPPMKSGRMPVQPLWLPLLSARKNFLCYIGRGVLLCLGARRVGSPGTQRHTLKHRGEQHGLSSEFRAFAPGGGGRHGGCCKAARRAVPRRSMWDIGVGGDR